MAKYSNKKFSTKNVEEGKNNHLNILKYLNDIIEDDNPPDNFDDPENAT